MEEIEYEYVYFEKLIPKAQALIPVNPIPCRWFNP